MGIDVEMLEVSEDERAGRRRSLNDEVASIFDDMADILEIKGDQPYRVNAYRQAARNVAATREGVDRLFAEGRLRDIRGIGDALEGKIVEYLSTGRVETYERLKREFPAGLVTLLGVPGLGPTRARTIYQELNITSVADLEQAAREGRLLEVPGFAQKSVDNLLLSLERMKQRTTRNLLSTGWAIAEDVRSALEPAASGRVAVVGSLRRMQETVGNVDLLAASEDAASLLEILADLPNAVEVLSRAEASASVLLYGGVEVRLHVVPASQWGSALVWYTGAPGHVSHLQRLAAERGWQLGERGLEAASGTSIAGGDERSVYEALGLPWIAPELREGAGEIEAGLEGTLPRLVELSDLKGDLHVHTNWTDGVNTLEEMAKAAIAKGYQYMALTDHSRSLTVARGLTPERLAEERRLVDRVNHKLAPFTVLLGTEMDILRDGALDFPDEVLASLDYVSASVHSAFNMPGPEMTQRIVRAVSNPYVNTLNHPHGRLLRRREPYDVDMKAVVAAAAAAGCALELNAQPDRLDLDGTWARRARAAGARFTISSDAHSTRNLDLLQYGVGSARRGWLTADDVLNTRPLTELRRVLAARRPGSASALV